MVDTGLALLAQASLPISFWTHAFTSAVYLINRLPTPVLHGKSPHEVLHKTIPNYQHLKVFGCRCYPYLRPFQAHKLQFRSQPCVFLGYSMVQKGYKCLAGTNRVFVSRHVVFDEGCFPFEAGSMIANTSQSTRALPMFQHQQCAVPIMGYRSGSISLSNSATAVPTSEPSIPQSVTPYRGSQVSRSLVHLSSHSPFTSACQNSADSSSSTDPHSCLPSSSIQVPPVNPSPMQPRSNLHPMQTRSKSGIFKPKVLTTELAAVEPVTIEQAFTSKEWTLVAQQEYEALMKNHTWDLVPLPADRKAVGCKWLFKLKKNPDGTIARYKGRLVVKGYLQEAGIDFQDTFSLVVKPMTIRVVLSLAIKLEWQLRQVDINNAFLNGELSEEIYMTQPLGFEQHSNNGLLVCRLKKALYGLKQTPRAWFSKLREFLLSSQFVCAKSDASLFVKKTDGVILYVLVYVDDIIITGNHQQSIDKFVSSLDTQFALKD